MNWIRFLLDIVNTPLKPFSNPSKPHLLLHDVDKRPALAHCADVRGLAPISERVMSLWRDDLLMTGRWVKKDKDEFLHVFFLEAEKM